MLMMCGCVGKSGGGWAHYVGQEKLRPQFGWRRWPSPRTGAPAAPDERHLVLLRPHQPVASREAERAGSVGPTADRGKYGELSMIDLNARAERMGWLPSAPQLRTNPLDLVAEAEAAGRTRWRTPSRA